MTCKETIRLICEYLDGKLSPGVVVDVRRHLDNCADCRLVLDAAQRTLAVYFSPEVEALAHPKSRVA